MLTVQFGDPDTGDGYSTRVGFPDRGVNDIYSLRVVGTRSGATAFGLGFDNFDTSNYRPQLPLPAPAALIGLGLFGLGWARRRKSA